MGKGGRVHKVRPGRGCYPSWARGLLSTTKGHEPGGPSPGRHPAISEHGPHGGAGILSRVHKPTVMGKWSAS